MGNPYKLGGGKLPDSYKEQAMTTKKEIDEAMKFFKGRLKWTDYVEEYNLALAALRTIQHYMKTRESGYGSEYISSDVLDKFHSYLKGE